MIEHRSVFSLRIVEFALFPYQLSLYGFKRTRRLGVET
uniref:Uncharacterized protein n=1 Tax=Arundo donax TaxID=35708 RepID=A0A0A9ADB2_ARUDO